jgi:hypothetical protein
MSNSLSVIRPGAGAPLDDETLEIVRRLIRERGSARRLVEVLGVSAPAIERAAGGGPIHKGTRLLIAMGLDRMRDAGELPGRQREADGGRAR